jgi:hypothetical protein
MLLRPLNLTSEQLLVFEQFGKNLWQKISNSAERVHHDIENGTRQNLNDSREEIHQLEIFCNKMAVQSLVENSQQK